MFSIIHRNGFVLIFHMFDVQYDSNQNKILLKFSVMLGHIGNENDVVIKSGSPSNERNKTKQPTVLSKQTFLSLVLISY